MAKPRTAPAAPAADAAAPAFDFERSLAELEALVGRLEQGDLPLEESLRSFERGVELTRACQAALARAEQKGETRLTQPDGSLAAVPFAGRDAPDEPG
jgi:exodeoxyribonuclease VII small subunit